MRLHLLTDSKDNNFTLLRLLAAVAVIYTHSWELPSLDFTDPIKAWLGRSPGAWAVDSFFIISGLLISQSWIRQKDIRHFVEARLFRIFPALLIVLVISCFLAGPLLTRLSPAAYFSHGETWKYFFNNLLLLHTEYHLPGIFETNNNTAFNGSLWTLRFEIKMYLAVALAGLLGIFASPRLRTGFFAVYALYYFGCHLAPKIAPAVDIDQTMLRLSCCFVVGAMVNSYRQYITLTPTWLIPLAIAAWVAGDSFLAAFSQTLLFTYIILLLAHLPQGRIRNFNKLGDYSYGTYLYAFPIQQTLAAFFPAIQPMAMFVAATLITLLFAALSWHCCEKPALAFARSRARQASAIKIAVPAAEDCGCAA